MEWVESNYKIVDITEYEMMLEKRRSTEDFVIKFFKNWNSNDASDKLVVICRDLVKEQRLQRMVNEVFSYSSSVKFSRSFRDMCTELFSEKVEDSHVIVLLAFSIVLDRTMKAEPWFSSSHLFTALIDSLVEASFDANNFKCRCWNHIDKVTVMEILEVA